MAYITSLFTFGCSIRSFTVENNTSRSGATGVSSWDATNCLWGEKMKIEVLVCHPDGRQEVVEKEVAEDYFGTGQEEREAEQEQEEE